MGYQVAIRPAGTTWQILGRDLAPGIMPQGLRCTADAWGPADCTFTLRRDTRVPWGDLVPFTEVDVYADGAGLVWSGRLWSTSMSADDSITVTCRGWQYLLDDDLLIRSYVRNGLAEFIDAKNVPGVALTAAAWNPREGFAAAVDTGSIRLGMPAAALVPGDSAGVVLDLQQADARAISLTYQNLTNGSANLGIFVRGADTAAGAGSIDVAGSPFSSLSAATGTFSGDLASNKRYVIIFFGCSPAGFTPANPPTIQITDVRVFSATTYRSGTTSILKASDVVTDMRTALTTWLSSDTSMITATTDNIDALTTGGRYETPRQILQRANAYHDYLLQVDANRRLVFTPRPTTPIIQIGDGTGATWADAGDSAEELYNRVIIAGFGTDGTTQNQVLTATSPLLNLNGYTRTKELTTEVPVTTAAATFIGNAYLTRRKDRPTRGVVTLPGSGAATYIGASAPVIAAEVLRYTGQLMRIGNRWSPDDGGNSRDGVISAASWDADTDTTTVTIDSPRADLQVVLARYAALQAARPQNY